MKLRLPGIHIKSSTAGNREKAVGRETCGLKILGSTGEERGLWNLVCPLLLGVTGECPVWARMTLEVKAGQVAASKPAS